MRLLLIHTPHLELKLSLPRDVPLEEPAGERELRSFSDLVNRPVVIVGNGPSAALPPHHRLPADAVIFRMNWFFLESHYHFGSRVDAWFYAIANQALERQLRNEIRERRYTISRLLSPMRVPAYRDEEKWFSQLYDLGLEHLDHWAVIAQNARLGRFCMSRPLPTQGMQALAFALATGFREVFLCGIDLYESHEARYGYVIPESVKGGLLEKDLRPGYEDKHSLDRDLAFLSACIEEFPSSIVHNLGESVNLARLLGAPPDLGDRACMSIATVPDLGRAKDRVVVRLEETGAAPAVVVRAPAGVEMWKDIGGRRCAYATLVAGDFHHGARALSNSLRQVSDVPLLALCTPTADRAALAASGIQTIDVPEIINPNELGSHNKRFVATYSKLNVFRLDFLSRVVYLDGDTVVRKNIDDLFDGDDFAAVPDAGLARPSKIFNSGVFAATPSRDLFEQMLEALEELESYDGGDQGFLNSFFSQWRPLPLTYNTTKRLYSHHAELFSIDDLKVLHYVGVKPWEPHTHPQRYAELDWVWLEHLQPWELRELVVELRHQASDRIPLEYSRGSLLRRAQARNRNRDYAAAEELMRREWPGESATAAEEREMASALREQGKWHEALPYLNQALRKNPSSKGIRRELSDVRAKVEALSTTGHVPEDATSVGSPSRHDPPRAAMTGYRRARRLVGRVVQRIRNRLFT